MNAFACFCREPNLEDVMNDPIVRLLMCQDQVTESHIRDLGRVVRRVRGKGAAELQTTTGAMEAPA